MLLLPSFFTKKNSRTLQGEFTHLSSHDYFDTCLVFNDRFLLPESLFFSVSNILAHLKAKVKEGQILFLTLHISRSLCYGISKIEMCSKIANTARTSALGYFPLFSSTNRIQCDTRRNKAENPFPSLLARGSSSQVEAVGQAYQPCSITLDVVEFRYFRSRMPEQFRHLLYG